MKYSIIIPVLGNIEWLDSLLASIERNCRRRHAEIVVVNDACSRDDSELMEFLKKQRRIDVLVEHGSPRGFAAAINSGIRNSCAGLLAIFHTDVVVGPNTLGRLASRLSPAGPASVVSATSDGPGFEHKSLLKSVRQYESAQREMLRETGRLP